MYLFFSLLLAVKLLSKVISFSTKSKINSSMSSICLSTVLVSLSISFSSWSEPDARPLSLILSNSWMKPILSCLTLIPSTVIPSVPTKFAAFFDFEAFLIKFSKVRYLLYFLKLILKINFKSFWYCFRSLLVKYFFLFSLISVLRSFISWSVLLFKSSIAFSTSSSALDCFSSNIEICWVILFLFFSNFLIRSLYS